MRVHGVRIDVAEKNIGRRVYSINALQVHFLPVMYRPPAEVLETLMRKDDTWKYNLILHDGGGSSISYHFRGTFYDEKLYNKPTKNKKYRVWLFWRLVVIII